MDIFKLLSDPKVILVALAVVALGLFVYFSWKRTDSSISELKNNQKRLQRQLAHGVISEERINPLRVDNASNMSEETMDYEYPDRYQHDDHDHELDDHDDHDDHELDDHDAHDAREQDSTEHTETDFESLVKFHRQGHGHGLYGVPLVPKRIPGRDALDDIRELKNHPDHDQIIIQDNDYETNSEEPIEFQDIDEDEEYGHSLSLMEQRKDELIMRKIQEDMIRMDKENIMQEQVQQAQKAQEAPKEQKAPEAQKEPKAPKAQEAPKAQKTPKEKETPKTQKAQETPKIKVKAKVPQKTKINPKLKI